MINTNNIFLAATLVAMTFFTACNKDNDPFGRCHPENITLTENGATSSFDFHPDFSGKLADISLYMGTDSAVNYHYHYDAEGMVIKIDKKNAVTSAIESYFEITSSGDTISKYQEFVYKGTQYVLSGEAQYVYSNGTLQTIKILGASSTGTLYQYADLGLTFSSNNAIRVQLNMDVLAFFSIIFGQTPTGYKPIKIGVQESLFDNSPNPLYGNVIPAINLINLGLSKNNLTQLVSIPAGGQTVTNTLSLTYNKKELVTSGSSDNLSYTVTYTGCKE